MKKILTIIPIIIVLSLGFSLRKIDKQLEEQSVNDAINEYNQSLAKIEEMKEVLEKNKNLSDKELAKLNELEEKYETLLITFNNYKKNYPETITEETKTINEENKSYANKVAELENKISNLNDRIVKPQQVVASSSSSSSTSNSSNSSSYTVYANGGRSKSNKYHATPTAHNMEGAIAMSESEAKSNGYVACKRCY